VQPWCGPRKLVLPSVEHAEREHCIMAYIFHANTPTLHRSSFAQHWCGPCKLVLPSVEWAEHEYSSQLKVVKVEADSNKDLVEKFKVPSWFPASLSSSESRHAASVAVGRQEFCVSATLRTQPAPLLQERLTEQVQPGRTGETLACKN